MAAPTNTPATGDIWHLSIDDLLAPLPETLRIGGPGPFVINLSASTAPIDRRVMGLPGCEHAHVYQVQRTEDRRRRYRLRLGPFANEDEAGAILTKVREVYPGALTATAGADDLRAIATIQAKTNAQATEPAAKPEPRAKPPALSPTAVSPPVLTEEAKPSAPDAPHGLASHGFAIQLSLAEAAFDPDTVPKLDIFSVYRLYSVAGIHEGRIVHALRLGFFSDQTAAGAVASYLAAFYDKPTIERVSAAERQRYAEQSLEPRKDMGATGKQAIIEITSERFVRDPRSAPAASK